MTNSIKEVQDSLNHWSTSGDFAFFFVVTLSLGYLKDIMVWLFLLGYKEWYRHCLAPPPSKPQSTSVKVCQQEKDLVNFCRVPRKTSTCRGEGSVFPSLSSSMSPPPHPCRMLLLVTLYSLTEAKYLEATNFVTKVVWICNILLHHPVFLCYFVLLCLKKVF